MGRVPRISTLRPVSKLLLASLFLIALSLCVLFAPHTSPIALASQMTASPELSEAPLDLSEPGLPEVAEFSWIQYKFFRVPNGYTAGIWARLPLEVDLPATVQIAIPEGADVFWFGPVPPEGVNPQSPQFPASHIYHDRENRLYIYTTVLTDSHELQIEHEFWGENFPFPVQPLPNGDHVIRISYTPLYDVDTLRLAAFLPAGSEVRDTNNVQYLGENAAGELAYAVEFPNARGLERYQAEIEYAPPESTARSNQIGISGGIIAAIAVVAVPVIAAALFVVLKRRKQEQE